jgi:hypothetical protein
MQLSNGSGNSNGVVVISNNNRIDGTLSQSMDSVNPVAAEEEVRYTCHRVLFCFSANFSVGVADLRHSRLIF